MKKFFDFVWALLSTEGSWIFLLVSSVALAFVAVDAVLFALAVVAGVGAAIFGWLRCRRRRRAVHFFSSCPCGGSKNEFSAIDKKIAEKLICTLRVCRNCGKPQKIVRAFYIPND